MENEKQNFLDEALSDGTVMSYGRLGSLIALLFSCTWITILVLRAKDFSGLPQLAIFLGACVAFISALYGLSKGADVIETIKTTFPKPPEQKQ